MIKFQNIVNILIVFIIISLLLQRFYGSTLELKAVQVLSATLGNLILIYGFRRVLLSKVDQLFLIVMICSLLMGLINVKNTIFLFYSTFPTINLIALSLGLMANKFPVDGEVRIKDKSLILILGVFLIISVVIILTDLAQSNRPFIYYRGTGLLFKPSSASYILCLIVLLVVSSRTLKNFLITGIVLIFKSMSSLMFLVISSIGSFHLLKSIKGRLFFIILGPILGLASIYIADIFYSRHLWMSVGTRFGIFLEFTLAGGGLGFGTNIILNATEAASRISDGTLSLLKFQFGLLGILWGFFLILFTIRMAIYSNFILGGIIALALFAFNIPEVALLSLLLPTILFRRFSSVN